MVIGNAVLMPANLVSPSATLTSQLTSQMGNTVMGTLPNNALWSLALLLLIMSLVFNFSPLNWKERTEIMNAKTRNKIATAGIYTLSEYCRNYSFLEF